MSRGEALINEISVLLRRNMKEMISFCPVKKVNK